MMVNVTASTSTQTDMSQIYKEIHEMSLKRGVRGLQTNPSL